MTLSHSDAQHTRLAPNVCGIKSDAEKNDFAVSVHISILLVAVSQLYSPLLFFLIIRADIKYLVLSKYLICKCVLL